VACVRVAWSALFLSLASLTLEARPQAVQLQKLVGSTVVAGQNFGRSVSIAGDDLIAGTVATSAPKKAFVFVRSGGTWSEQAALLGPSYGSGLRVAIRGDLALIGAPEDFDGYCARFERVGTSWSGPFGMSPSPGLEDLGFSVAIAEGPLLLVGGPRIDSNGQNEAGVVGGYCPNGTGWSLNLSLADPNAPTSVYHERFGSALATSGSTIAVGANGFDPYFQTQTGGGQVFVFEKSCSGGSSTPTAVLSGPGPRFGESVALDGDVLIVGQPGAAFAYARVGASWVGQGTLDPQDPLAGAQYGVACAVRGDIAVVGDPTSAVAGSGAGALYVFRRSGASWSRIQVLTGSDTVAGDQFGSALSISDGTFVAGAPFADAAGIDSGALYLFQLPLAPPHTYCTGKTNSQGCVPQIGFDGIPSASAPAVFDVSAIQELNQKTGMLLYGTNGIATLPFQGATLCIAAPLHRTYGQSSGGSPPPANDCTGVYHYDFNARIQSGFDPGLVPGVSVAAQYWSRDPLDAYGTGLSDALLFTVGP
jgi:FG-GAP repeat